VRARLVGALVLVALSVGASAASADPVGQTTEYSAGLIADSYPLGIAPGTDGNMWFTDAGREITPAIGRITPSGQIAEYSVGLNPGSLPVGIAPGPDGNMWFADQGSKPAIGKITPSGQITEYSYGHGLNAGSEPFEIAPGPDGNMWFTDQGSTPAIGQITPAGKITEYSYGHGLNAGSFPWGIAAAPDGDMWFADRGTTPAIGQITPSSGRITEFSSGLNPGSQPKGITLGPDGDMWFTDTGNSGAIGRITPSGVITEFFPPGPPIYPVGIAAGANGNMWFADSGAFAAGRPAIGQITPFGQITEYPGVVTQTQDTREGIAPGADGNLWFTDQDAPAIGRIGTGAPPAVQTPATLTGPGQAGSAESCGGAQWNYWTGVRPFVNLYGFDGDAWLRDGSPIAGQTGPTYTPTAADVGHQLSCRATVTYPLPFQLSASTTSAPVTIQPAAQPAGSPPPAASPPPPTPALSKLRVSPRTFALRGRRVGRRCERSNRADRHDRPCTRRVRLRVNFTLNESASVTVKIERQALRRSRKGRCQAHHRHRRSCTGMVELHGRIVFAGTAGDNRLMFHGAIGGHKLRPGRYRLLATLSAGHSGHWRQTTFQIVR